MSFELHIQNHMIKWPNPRRWNNKLTRLHGYVQNEIHLRRYTVHSNFDIKSPTVIPSYKGHDPKAPSSISKMIEKIANAFYIFKVWYTWKSILERAIRLTDIQMHPCFGFSYQNFPFSDEGHPIPENEDSHDKSSSDEKHSDFHYVYEPFRVQIKEQMKKLLNPRRWNQKLTRLYNIVQREYKRDVVNIQEK